MQRIPTPQTQIVKDAIQAQFGAVANVFPGEPPVAFVPPNPERPYQTLVTLGMSNRVMQIPTGVQAAASAELVIMLPPEMPLTATAAPVQWLRMLAAIPWRERSWLGFGHTIPIGAPLTPATKLNSFLLLDAFLPDGAGNFLVPQGMELQFYQLFPLYEQELQFKLQHGVEALLTRLETAGLLSPVVAFARKNACLTITSAKRYRFGRTLPQKTRPPAVLIDTNSSCLATRQVLYDGAAVGYCYREEPREPGDSGWRFTSGEESDAYMEDAANTEVVTLQRMLQLDGQIASVLDTPFPCAFLMNEIHP